MVEWRLPRPLVGEWLCPDRRKHQHGWDRTPWLFLDVRPQISNLQPPTGGGRVGKAPPDCWTNAEALSHTLRWLPHCGRDWHRRSRDDSGPMECPDPGAGQSEIVPPLAQCDLYSGKCVPTTHGPARLSDRA